jgi:ATP-binding cassette subfamily B protein
MDPVSAGRRLWRVLGRPQRRMLARLAFLSVLASLAEVALLAAVIPFTLAITGSGRAGGWMFGEMSLAAAAALFLAAITLAALMRLLLLAAQAACTKRVSMALARQSFAVTLNRPYLDHVRSNTNDVAITLTMRLDAVVDGIVIPLVGAVAQAVVGVAIAVALILVSPRATLLLLAVLGGTYLVLLHRSRRLIAREAERYSRAIGRLGRTISEALFGIRDVILAETQPAWIGFYEEAQEGLREAKRRMTLGMAAPRLLVEWIGYALIVGIAWALARSGRGGGEAVAALAVIALGAQRLLPVAQGLFGAWNSFRATLPHLVELLLILEAPPAPPATPAGQPLRLERQIAVRSLGYTYPGGSRPVLDKVDMAIDAGAVVGIVGRTGCGKSTLLDLLMGLLHPTLGEIAVDDTPLSPATAPAWQRGIAHVPQTVHLADATIAQNIALAAPGEEVDGERLVEAARIAQLESFILGLPKGYDSPVGERGILLSGGQRQRVGIARALYRGGDLLVLDEATNALDEETEAALLGGLTAGGARRTLVLVTHRASILARCHRVYRISADRSDGPCSGVEVVRDVDHRGGPRQRP